MPLFRESSRVGLACLSFLNPIVYKYIYCYSLSESDSSAAALASRALTMSLDASLVSAFSRVPDDSE